eukprot:5845949-Lingulodinium_polyedra.AAC.1
MPASSPSTACSSRSSGSPRSCHQMAAQRPVGTYISDQELPADRPHGLCGLPEICFLGNRVLSDASPVAWDKYVQV